MPRVLGSSWFCQLSRLEVLVCFVSHSLDEVACSASNGQRTEPHFLEKLCHLMTSSLWESPQDRGAIKMGIRHCSLSLIQFCQAHADISINRSSLARYPMPLNQFVTMIEDVFSFQKNIIITVTWACDDRAVGGRTPTTIWLPSNSAKWRRSDGSNCCLVGCHWDSRRFEATALSCSGGVGES